MPVEFKIKVVKVGNSLRITIPGEIAESMRIRAGDVVGISLDDNRMIVRKILKDYTRSRVENPAGSQEK